MGVSRRAVLRVLGGTAVLAAAVGTGIATCDPMPGEAVAGWRGPDPKEIDPRRRALSWALLAPNPHNYQSWLADLRDEGVITLWTDRARLLPETDPFGRQIMIGCGCFLEIAMLALAAEGIEARLSDFPDGGAAAPEVGLAPFARIVLGGTGAARDPLFDQVAKRRSAKIPYGARVPDAAALAALAAAAGPAVEIRTATDGPQVERLKSIAKAAWRIEVDTDRTYRESVDLMRIGGDAIATHRDGLEMHGPLFWWTRVLGMSSPEAQMAPGSTFRAMGRSYLDGQVDATPAFVWMTTDGNDRRAQLEAGRAWVRLNLKATELGLGVAPLSQVIQEYAEMAALQRDFRAEIGTPAEATVQMFARLGYADPPDPTPRRPLDAILMA